MLARPLLAGAKMKDLHLPLVKNILGRSPEGPGPTFKTAFKIPVVLYFFVKKRLPDYKFSMKRLFLSKYGVKVAAWQQPCNWHIESDLSVPHPKVIRRLFFTAFIKDTHLKRGGIYHGKL